MGTPPPVLSPVEEPSTPLPSHKPSAIPTCSDDDCRDKPTRPIDSTISPTDQSTDSPNSISPVTPPPVPSPVEEPSTPLPSHKPSAIPTCSDDDCSRDKPTRPI